MKFLSVLLLFLSFKAHAISNDEVMISDDFTVVASQLFCNNYRPNPLSLDSYTNPRFQGVGIVVDHRSETKLLAMTMPHDRCGNKEVTVNVNGKVVVLKPYRLQDTVKLDFDRKDRTYKMVLFDPAQRALLLVWQSMYCNGPDTEGAVLVKHPEQIYMLQNLLRMPEEERREFIPQLVELFGMTEEDLNDQIHLALYEIDLFPAENLDAKNINIDYEMMRILIRLRTTNNLAEHGVYIPIRTCN